MEEKDRVIAEFKMKFNGTEKLYHYTSFESALKILCGKKLLYSQLTRLNDINESKRAIYVESSHANNQKLEEISKNNAILSKVIQNFRQISLTADTQRPGFAIPAMWGHYAQKGDGVCLVFDKNEIEEQLPANVYKSIVKYEDRYDSSIIMPMENVNSCLEYLRKHKDTLFFTKTSDWSYEQEYRIIKEDDRNDYLDISGTLMAVIICDLPNIQPEQDCVVSAKDAVLHQLAGDIPICRYALFVDEYNLTWEDSEIWNSRDLGNFVTEGIDSDSLNMNNINTND